ncbi:MAG: family 10 glycosylhydrolase [Clostridia bacterium]|nr:family 10 glycosylhydrolase [Clostridia bacterium]
MKKTLSTILVITLLFSLVGTIPAFSFAEGRSFALAVFSVDGTHEQVKNDILKWFDENTVTADGEIIDSVTVDRITADEIAQGKLSAYDTLIVADACSASINMGKTVMNALGTTAAAKIKDYVAAGGGYLGIGGGAYAATQSFTKNGDTHTFMNLVRFKVDYPVWNHGGGEVVFTASNTSHTITKGMKSVVKYLAFTDAPPVFTQVTKTTDIKDSRAQSPTILLKYYSNLRNGLGAAVNVNQNAYTNMTNTAALSVSNFASGRVVISGLLLQASQTTNLEFLLSRSALYAAGFNNITEVKRSVEQKKFDVVGEWVWASEVTSNGANAVAQRCKEFGVTDIYLLVKGGGGKVAFNKGVVPLARTNTSRDVLQEMVTAGHKYGIRVHAWISALNDETYAADHIQETLYHYKRGYNSREMEYDWATMDPTLPNFANYTQRLLAEMVQNYDIDGVHFDYIRYNHIAYGWSTANIKQMEDEYGINVATLKSYVDDTYYNAGAQAAKIFRMAASGECGYGEGIDATRFMQMRCDNIRKFAQGLVDAIRAVKPNIIISAALMPEGAYEGHQYISGRNDNQTASNTYGKMVFGQDFKDAAKLYDYVCPMAYSYTYTASPQWMAAMAENAAKMGNKVVMGMQAFSPDADTAYVTSKTMMAEIEQLRKVASSDGVLGLALFRQGLYAYAKSTYSKEQKLLEVKINNAFSTLALENVVIEMQDGMIATTIAGYKGVQGEGTVSDDGKKVTVTGSALVPKNGTLSIFLTVDGALNESYGPCFVNVYSSANETRAYQIYEEGTVTLPPAPTPLPTIAGSLANFTMQQVVDAAVKVNDYAKANGGELLSNVKIGNYTVPAISLYRMACVALYNINIGAPNTSLISYIKCSEPTGSNNHTFTGSTITRPGYLYIANRQIKYMNENSNRAASYVTLPGESNLSYEGQFTYDNSMRVFVRALTFYNKYGILPAEVATGETEGTTPTPPPTQKPLPTIPPTPTPEPTQETVPTPSPTPVATPTATVTPIPSPTVSPTLIPTATPTTEPTQTPEDKPVFKQDSTCSLTDDGYVIGINVNTTVEDFYAFLSEDTDALVMDEGNEEAALGDRIVTGFVLSVIDGSGHEHEYKIAVTGDINCDGKVNSRDVAAIQKHLVDIESLDELKQKAADTKRDGKVNSRDIASLQKLIIGYEDAETASVLSCGEKINWFFDKKQLCRS